MPFDLSTLRLPEEAALHRHLEEIFNGKVIGQLLDLMDAREGANRLQDLAIRENLLPISERLSPEIHRACGEATAALHYAGKPVDFYLSNTPDVNAFSILAAEHVERHCVVLNAGLVDLLGGDELRFVVGHELAHLVFAHSRFSRVVQLVYPQFEQIPTYLQRRYVVWSKLNEMGSDRLGLLACGDLDTAVRAMLRISGGVSPRHFSQGLAPFYELVDRLLADLGQGNAATDKSHPATALRVKALQIFDASDTCRALRAGQAPGEDVALAERMSEVTRLLKYLPSTDRERAIVDFLASAGLLLASSDGEIDEREANQLVNLLSRHCFFPHEVLLDLQKTKKVVETLKASAAYLAREHAEETRGLMDALAPVILRDGRLHDREVEAFLQIATEELGLPAPEVVDMLLGRLRRSFQPMG